MLLEGGRVGTRGWGIRSCLVAQKGCASYAYIPRQRRSESPIISILRTLGALPEDAQVSKCKIAWPTDTHEEDAARSSGVRFSGGTQQA